jgi:hypothetical protein
MEIVVDTRETRKPHVVLAFIAGFLGMGLGYVYVGRLRLGLITIAGFCLTIGFFAWTRLIVQSATMLWLLAALLMLIALIALVHPVVIASRDCEVSAKRYNRWWFYLIWSLGTVAPLSSDMKHFALPLHRCRHRWNRGSCSCRIPGDITIML